MNKGKKFDWTIDNKELINVIKESYQDYYTNYLIKDLDNYYYKFLSEHDKKVMFLAGVIMDITTDDYDIDLKIGRDIYEVMKVIYEKRNSKYIESNDENYKKYIMICNILERNEWINSGSSIRSAWFECNSNRKVALWDKYLTKESLDELMKWLEN